MPGDRLYVVAYDIGHPKRWRRVFRLMHGYGRWLQHHEGVRVKRHSGRKRPGLIEAA